MNIELIKEALQLAIDLPEQNTSNYSHDDIEELNDHVIKTIQAAVVAIDELSTPPILVAFSEERMTKDINDRPHPLFHSSLKEILQDNTGAVSVDKLNEAVQFVDHLVNCLGCGCDRDRHGNVIGHWTNVAGSTAVEDGKCSNCKDKE